MATTYCSTTILAIQKCAKVIKVIVWISCRLLLHLVQGGTGWGYLGSFEGNRWMMPTKHAWNYLEGGFNLHMKFWIDPGWNQRPSLARLHSDSDNLSSMFSCRYNVVFWPFGTHNESSSLCLSGNYFERMFLFFFFGKTNAHVKISFFYLVFHRDLRRFLENYYETCIVNIEVVLNYWSLVLNHALPIKYILFHMHFYANHADARSHIFTHIGLIISL